MAVLNKFSGFCVTCLKQVGAAHGALAKSASGAWVVQCGAATNGRVAVAPAARNYGRARVQGRGRRPRGYPGCNGRDFCDECSE